MLLALLNSELAQNKELAMKIKYEKDHVFSFMDPVFLQGVEENSKNIKIDFLDKEPQINKNMYASINFGNKKADDHQGFAAASMVLEKNQFKNETFSTNFRNERVPDRKPNNENMSPNQGIVEGMQALAQSHKCNFPLLSHGQSLPLLESRISLHSSSLRSSLPISHSTNPRQILHSCIKAIMRKIVEGINLRTSSR